MKFDTKLSNRCMFPETVEVCNRRIEANTALVKAMIKEENENKKLHILYEPALYAAARRSAHFGFYLCPELREQGHTKDGL